MLAQAVDIGEDAGAESGDDVNVELDEQDGTEIGWDDELGEDVGAEIGEDAGVETYDATPKGLHFLRLRAHA